VGVFQESTSISQNAFQLNIKCVARGCSLRERSTNNLRSKHFEAGGRAPARFGTHPLSAKVLNTIYLKNYFKVGTYKLKLRNQQEGMFKAVIKSIIDDVTHNYVRGMPLELLPEGRLTYVPQSPAMIEITGAESSGTLSLNVTHRNYHNAYEELRWVKDLVIDDIVTLFEKIEEFDGALDYLNRKPDNSKTFGYEFDLNSCQLRSAAEYFGEFDQPGWRWSENRRYLIEGEKLAGQMSLIRPAYKYLAIVLSELESQFRHHQTTTSDQRKIEPFLKVLQRIKDPRNKAKTIKNLSRRLS